MSHWKQFSNDALTNTKVELLGKALAEMGVTLDTGIKHIQNTWGNERVDMGFKYKNKTIALGFREVTVGKDKKLELVGDFYATGLNEETFMDKVSQIYTKEDIINKINKISPYTIESVTENANGEIEILAYQYA